jgi:cobalt-zinc-cadmium efflux system outer membrane protein
LIDAARGRLDAAQGSRQTAGAPPNPVATWWRDTETSVYATLPIEPFFQRSSRVAQADADLRAAQSGVQGAEQDAALQAAQAFYRAALAQSAVDAAKENRDGLQEVVDYLQVRVTQGASAEGDGIRAQVERDRADVDLTLANVELLHAQAALRPWLGADAGPVGSIRVTLPVVAGAPAVAPLSELSAHALAARPDILASRARRDAARDAVDVERMRATGQLGASLGVKRSDGANFLAAGLGMTVPVFDRNHGEIRRATGEQLAADAETRWLERTVLSDLEGAYDATARLTAQVAALQPAFVQRAQESRQIALGALREGAATLLQVLDASRALTDVRLTYTRAQVAANQSLFELRIMAGYDAKTAASQGGVR